MGVNIFWGDHDCGGYTNLVDQFDQGANGDGNFQEDIPWVDENILVGNRLRDQDKGW